jgi:preprotein translocase subunit Sec61beta
MIRLKPRTFLTVAIIIAVLFISARVLRPLLG